MNFIDFRLLQLAPAPLGVSEKLDSWPVLVVPTGQFTGVSLHAKNIISLLGI